MTIIRHLPVLLSLTLALSACNLPGAHSNMPDSPPPAEVSPTPPDNPAEESSPVDAATEASPAPNASPTPDQPPPNWQIVTRPALALTFYAPPGWELVPADNDAHLDLYENDGPGWLSIDVITTANADRWGIPYSSSLSAEALIDAIIAPLNQNGAFPPSQPLLTRSGRTARVTSGLYDLTDEYLLVGIITLSDRAWLFLGHGPDPTDPAADTLWDDQQTIYQQVLASLAPPE